MEVVTLMQKIILLFAVMVLIFYPQNITQAKALSPVPETGEYSFGLEVGPKIISLGDALINLPENSSMLKFSSPSTDSNQISIPATYGIVNIPSSESSPDLTLNYIFFRTGYIQDTSLSFAWVNEMFGLIAMDQEEKVTLMSLEDGYSYILIAPDEIHQERSFTGILPSRHGVLLFSYESSLQNSYQRDLLAFNRLMADIRFIQDTQYGDYMEQNDPIYPKTLSGFLEDFIITPLLMEAETTVKNEPSPSDFFSSLEKTLTPSGTTNIFNHRNQTPSSSSNPPTWVIPLGIVFLLWGGIKGILKNLKKPKSNDTEEIKDPKDINTL
jgi:hypothetical protein